MTCKCKEEAYQDVLDMINEIQAKTEAGIVEYPTKSELEELYDEIKAK